VTIVSAMLRPLLVVLACLLVAWSTAGCGTSADRDQARHAAEELYRAADAHDGAAACAQMSPSLRSQLVSDEGGPCAKAVLHLDLAGAASEQVEVYANEALVRLKGGDTVFLSATHLGWRVDALGCRPDGEGPYDCEAES
jgi:hypothetical protein